MKFKRLHPDAVLPRRGTASSAGLDLYACLEEPVTLLPGARQMIPTGWACDPERSDVFLMICARSGLASRYGITLSNSVGIVDADYRGEIRVPLVNLGQEPYTLAPGDRFAQLIVVPFLAPEVEEAEELSDSDRGTSGFGSTGNR